MFHKLHLQGAWSHQDVSFNFSPGHTAITGRNGKGKSLIPELIQYALWGIKAVRGDAPDYKTVKVDLWFTLKGQEYRVYRSATKVLLETVDGKPVASGTKPVNAAVARLFGYSWEVWQIANAANQGSIERLGNMLPTERKRMVDETIRLNVIDHLEKLIATERSTLGTQIATLEGVLVAPVKPEPIEGWVDQEVAQATIQRLQQATHARAVLRSKVEAPLPAVQPWNARGDEDQLADLEKAQAAFLQDREERRAAQDQHSKLPKAVDEEVLHPRDAELETLQAQQNAHNTARDRKTTLDNLLKGKCLVAPHTRDYIERQYDLHNLQTRREKRVRLEAEQVQYCCPKCDHKWHDEDPRLKDYDDVKTPPKAPEFSMAELGAFSKQLNEAESLADLGAEREALVVPEAPEAGLVHLILTQRQKVAVYQASKAVEDLRKSLEVRLCQSPVLSKQSQIEEIKGSLEAKRKHDSDTLALMLATEKICEARDLLAQLPKDLDDQLTAAQDAKTRSAVYDSNMARYTLDVVKYDKSVAELADDKKDFEGWSNAREALTETRAQVKGYLLPSLNKVSSNLFQEMTGGELKEVFINEDFEVTIDGVGLKKLSGAGKAVANLALRLGLGQVLTHKSFPVLLLDEIDASCDDTRAAYISECLARLSKKMDQVIVISHKPTVTAEHRIEL